MRVTGSIAIILSMLLCGNCSNQQSMTKRVEGIWNRSTIRGCNPEIATDRLVLRENGVLEQHVILRDGRDYDFTGTWTIESSSAVKLTSWVNTFRYTGKEDLLTAESIRKIALRYEEPSRYLSGRLKWLFLHETKIGRIA